MNFLFLSESLDLVVSIWSNVWWNIQSMLQSISIIFNIKNIKKLDDKSRVVPSENPSPKTDQVSKKFKSNPISVGKKVVNKQSNCTFLKKVRVIESNAKIPNSKFRIPNVNFQQKWQKDNKIVHNSSDNHINSFQIQPNSDDKTNQHQVQNTV